MCSGIKVNFKLVWIKLVLEKKSQHVCGFCHSVIEAWSNSSSFSCCCFYMCKRFELFVQLGDELLFRKRQYVTKIRKKVHTQSATIRKKR